MEFKLVSSLEKIGTGKEPEALRNAPLCVLLGETASLQILYRCGSERQEGGLDETVGPEEETDRAEMTIRLSQTVRMRESCCAGEFGKAWAGGPDPEERRDASGGSDIAEKLGLRVRQVLPVMCRRSCDPHSNDEDYLFYDARMAPDLLRDLDPEGRITADAQWRSLWVDVCPQEDLAAGVYQIHFTFLPDGDGCPRHFAEVTAEIQVIGRYLPRLPIPHTEWFYCDCIADYYGVEVFSEEFWRIFRNFLTVYVKRGGNMILTPIVTPPLDTEIGGERTTVQLVDVERTKEGYRLGFGNLERFLDICLDAGILYFEICHLFTQWGAAAAPKVIARTEGAARQIFGWDTPSDDPGYLGFLSVLLPALKALLERRGLLERTFFHISDEPDLNSEHYQTSQGTVRRLLEGCTIVEAVSDYGYYERGLVDIPVCGINYIEPFLERRPPKLWSYYCCAQTKEVPNRFISMPSWRNRIYGILLYWHRIDGILHWGYNFYNSSLSKKKIDPYETVDGDEGFPAGDPFLVYPGKDGVPEESIRLMVFQEALNDYCALCLLEAQIGREPVMELIRREAGMELSFTRYPRNGEFILRLREKVNRLLA